jgi:PAS domain S-box-containing protein
MDSDTTAPHEKLPTILVVDDDHAICSIYSALLVRSGYAVKVALSFHDAAQLMAETDFDVLISDIVLGEKDGLDILEQSQRLQPDTPVILVTGLPDVQTAAAAVRLNAYAYLAKPVSKEILVATVMRALQLKALRTEKKRIEHENRNYQRNLEQLVAARTRKLNESNKRYQLLFENSRDAIYMADWKGGFLAVNQALVELFGFSREEIMAGRLGLLHADPKRQRQLRAEIERDGFIKDFDVKLRRKDGAILECLVTAHILTDAGGHNEGYQGIVRDVTAQRQAEEKIRKQNAFLTNVIESLGHPFIVIDVRDYSVKIANAAARRLQGQTGNTCHALNHGLGIPCQESGIACPLEQVRRWRRPVHMTHVHKDCHGKTAEHEVHAFPLLDTQGMVTQVIQYCIDITEKKRLEAIAEAANLMENLGYIFSGIRHEIGNPLNSVKMALSVLSMNLETYPRTTIREFVDRSLGEISRVEYLLKALKNFSMFETPDVEPVQIGAFMRNFKTLVEKDFRQKGILIRVRLPADDISVMTDPRAFHQLMLNLITNAADALANREAPRIDIEAVGENGLVSVTVRDNGCGMTEVELQNTFKPFHTSKASGTGLGLVIVKKMLSKMDSTIRIDSTLGQGTVVTMTLPMADKDEYDASHQS